MTLQLRLKRRYTLLLGYFVQITATCRHCRHLITHSLTHKPSVFCTAAPSKYITLLCIVLPRICYEFKNDALSHLDGHVSRCSLIHQSKFVWYIYRTVTSTWLKDKINLTEHSEHNDGATFTRSAWRGTYNHLVFAGSGWRGCGRRSQVALRIILPQSGVHRK